MNIITKSLAALALAAAGMAALAQDSNPPTPPEGGPGRPRMVPPIIAALDANHDGVIDTTEIANAVAALKSLDRNGDGQLTKEEIQPARPEGGRGPGGPGGPGGKGGPGGRRGPGGPGGPGGEGRPPRPAPAE